MKLLFDENLSPKFAQAPRAVKRRLPDTNTASRTVQPRKDRSITEPLSLSDRVSSRGAVTVALSGPL
jgi:hypothetical protein